MKLNSQYREESEQVSMIVDDWLQKVIPELKPSFRQDRPLATF